MHSTLRDVQFTCGLRNFKKVESGETVKPQYYLALILLLLYFDGGTDDYVLLQKIRELLLKYVKELEKEK